MGQELSWILDETEVLSRFRDDVPANVRSALRAAGDEPRKVRQLWQACLQAVIRADAVSNTAAEALVRHRDFLLVTNRIDTDAWIHPPLIRFLASYLDQGLAHWSMPDRERGIHGCFLEIYSTSLAAQNGRWARALPRIIDDDRTAGRLALDSIAHSLAQLGVTEAETS